MRFLLTALCLENILVGLANELFLGTFQPFSAGYRFSGTFYTNFQAWNDAILVLLALSYIAEGNVRAAVKYGLLGVGLTFLLLTNSRTSMVCLLAATGFWFGVRKAAHRSSGSRALFICAGFLAAAAVFLHGSGLVVLGDVAQALLGTKRDDGDIGSLTGRVELWEACLRFAADHWQVGFGYGGFWTPERILEISNENQWGINQAHSAYLDQFLASGAVGLTLYASTLLIGVGVAMRRFWLFQSEMVLIQGTLLVFAILHGMTESIATTPVLSGGTLLMLLTAKLAFAPRGRREE